MAIHTIGYLLSKVTQESLDKANRWLKDLDRKHKKTGKCGDKKCGCRTVKTGLQRIEEDRRKEGILKFRKSIQK